MTMPPLPDDLADQLALASRPVLVAALSVISARLAEAEFDDDPDLIGLKRAGAIAGGRSWDAMRRWAEKFGLGHALETGEWVIDRRRLLAFLKTPKGERLMRSKRGRKSQGNAA